MKKISLSTQSAYCARHVAEGDLCIGQRLLDWLPDNRICVSKVIEPRFNITASTERNDQPDGLHTFTCASRATRSMAFNRKHHHRESGNYRYWSAARQLEVVLPRRLRASSPDAAIGQRLFVCARTRRDAKRPPCDLVASRRGWRAE